MLPGVSIELGDRQWVVPPLTLGQLRRLLPRVAGITRAGDLNVDQIDSIVALVATALRRNYPEVDDEAVAEMLDLGNAVAVLNAVLSGSGLRRGEAGAAPGDGTSFTASSPPLSAIDPATSTS